MKRKLYEKELRKLQVELCHLQRWVTSKGLRAIILFEGRDAAGKGGTIKALTEKVSPRVFRTVALPAPSDREKTQIFFQRYVPHLPAAGEIVIFDRSWYNRAGVEYVMGFCSKEEHKRFLLLAPEVEKYIVDAGIILIKYWLEAGMEEQEKRFNARIDDPLRQWKLSPMDLESYRRWYDYSRARDLMLKATDFEACAVVRRSLRRQKTRAAELHLALAKDDPLQAPDTAKGQIAKEIRQEPIQRPCHVAPYEVRARTILESTTLGFLPTSKVYDPVGHTSATNRPKSLPSRRARRVDPGTLAGRPLRKSSCSHNSHVLSAHA